MCGGPVIKKSKHACLRCKIFLRTVKRFCSIAPPRRAVKKTLIVPPIIILALVSTVVLLSVHHSGPVSYSQLVTLKGTVTEFIGETRIQ